MSAAMDLLLPFLLAWAITTCQVPQPTQDQELAISSLLYYCICATFHPMKASINQSNYEERKDNFTLEKLLLRGVLLTFLPLLAIGNPSIDVEIISVSGSFLFQIWALVRKIVFYFGEIQMSPQYLPPSPLSRFLKNMQCIMQPSLKSNILCITMRAPWPVSL